MNKSNAAKRLSKKETRKIIFKKLSTALAEYKTELKEKKFDRELKKFSKELAAGIAKASARQNGKALKTNKKLADFQPKPVNELQPTN
ncbi:MAG: hypothetical protein E6H06_09970 [Bacteroidetes bacterium]|nr:MAG: hypothetical protein E6H06_09970 [Bacteroidota bacterium]